MNKERAFIANTTRLAMKNNPTTLEHGKYGF